jgi:hypothetical protein
MAMAMLVYIIVLHYFSYVAIEAKGYRLKSFWPKFWVSLMLLGNEKSIIERNEFYVTPLAQKTDFHSLLTMASMLSYNSKPTFRFVNLMVLFFIGFQWTNVIYIQNYPYFWSYRYPQGIELLSKSYLIQSLIFLYIVFFFSNLKISITLVSLYILLPVKITYDSNFVIYSLILFGGFVLVWWGVVYFVWQTTTSLHKKYGAIIFLPISGYIFSIFRQNYVDHSIRAKLNLVTIAYKDASIQIYYDMLYTFLFMTSGLVVLNLLVFAIRMSFIKNNSN